MKNNDIIIELVTKIKYIHEKLEVIDTYNNDILYNIESVITNIKNSNNKVLIDEYFNILQDIFFELEKIIWNNNYNFSKKLLDYVKDFDRIDTEISRKIILKKIQE
jgi:carbohydrate-binding DOMON domain-containing protein